MMLELILRTSLYYGTCGGGYVWILGQGIWFSYCLCSVYDQTISQAPDNHLPVTQLSGALCLSHELRLNTAQDPSILLACTDTYP
ncbi:hypothetical protein BDW66DRAFT_133721 [Aspergillus desertorum]